MFQKCSGEMSGAHHFPTEVHQLIRPASLTDGDQTLMGADTPPDRYHSPKGMNVSIHVKEKAEAERIFNALAEGGNVTMPFSQTFWSPGFGMCNDRFGIPWMVNTEQQS